MVGRGRVPRFWSTGSPEGQLKGTPDASKLLGAHLATEVLGAPQAEVSLSWRASLGDLRLGSQARVGEAAAWDPTSVALVLKRPIFILATSTVLLRIRFVLEDVLSLREEEARERHAGEPFGRD